MKMAQGWQVMLADLALILFLSTAAALVTGEPAPSARASGPADLLTALPADPVSVFREGGPTTFGAWLATRATDPREHLTILARHTAGNRAAALATAGALAQEAAGRGMEARIVVEPARRNEVLALFAFSLDPAQIEPM